MKTVELVPTWEASLNICVRMLEYSANDISSKKVDERRRMRERIDILHETFLPLCRAMDAQNERNRAAKEAEAAKDPTVCSACADTLPCGHATVDEEAKCALCGGEGEI